MPNSIVALKIQEQNIEATLFLPLSELESAFGKPLCDNAPLASEKYEKELKAYVQQHIKINSPNGLPWSIIVNDINLSNATQVSTGINYNELIVKAQFVPPHECSNRIFTLNYEVILHQVATHSALIKIEQDWNNGIHNDAQPLEVGVIAWDIPSNKILPFQVNLGEGSTWKGFKSMFQLGMSHIYEGTDHLLFLLVLLLPSPLLVENKRWSRYIGLKESTIKLCRIITAFTVGHSITLLLGSLNWFSFSGNWVEIWIAVTILISAIHALYPIFYRKEIYIAAGFGLIHGLAFSSVLANLNLTPTQRGLSILGFNLGIEAVQLLIMALILPCFLIIANTNLQKYKKVKTIGVAISMIASLSWLCQRWTSKSNFLTPFLDKIPQYLSLFIAIIVAYACWTYLRTSGSSKLSKLVRR